MPSGPEQNLPAAPGRVGRLPIVLTSASWLCNMLAFVFMGVFVGDSGLLPGDVIFWSGIPDEWVRAAFFGAFGCAALATGLGWLALHSYPRSNARDPKVGFARAGFVTGRAIALLHAAGLCFFLYLYVGCGQHC